MTEDTYKDGSFGSRICSSNIKTYGDDAKLSEFSPSETDHKMKVNECAFRAPTASEMMRRHNSRIRDRRHRWAIETGPLAVETDSRSLKVANEHVAKLDK